ncbi:hypothetical protein [Streptomyces xantholiticus]|uniref:hypothetical protein n=1 Tax=Streptomyces xantholiticus TaxID=68285 RepID=UPI001678611B|nr:hypothetical protein [Streptomyces xantholiticus]GGW67337.1 hypothetical protein GCM10010381_60340 [Streptomyces xantholiticus]
MERLVPGLLSRALDLVGGVAVISVTAGRRAPPEVRSPNEGGGAGYKIAPAGLAQAVSAPPLKSVFGTYNTGRGFAEKSQLLHSTAACRGSAQNAGDTVVKNIPYVLVAVSAQAGVWSSVHGVLQEKLCPGATVREGHVRPVVPKSALFLTSRPAVLVTPPVLVTIPYA